MDLVSTTISAIGAINTLVAVYNEVMYNREQCARLVERIEGLRSPLNTIKNKNPPDAGQHKLLQNILATVQKAVEFVGQFQKKNKSILRGALEVFKRKDYSVEFKVLHEEVTQHVGDLQLSETVLAGGKLANIMEKAKRADDEHLANVLVEMSDQLEKLDDNQLEQKKMIREMEEALGERLESLQSAVAMLNVANKEMFRYNEVAKGDIKISRELGRGTYAVVKKGTWENSQVALKIFPSDFVTRQHVSMARKEAQVLENLKHANVVGFYGLCSDFPTLMIVMELADCSLDQCIYDKNLNLPMPARYNAMLGVTAGMGYVHSQDILHRDLKSFNVLMKRRGIYDPDNFKLTDFGLAHDTGNNISASLRSKGGGGMGTQGWIAPEAGSSDANYRFTVQADVYSLGIFFYEVLARHKPFEGKSERDVFRMVWEKKRPDDVYPVEPGVADEASRLMRACWSEEPQRRPSTGDVWDTVETICNAHPYAHTYAPATPPPPPDVEEMMREMMREQLAEEREKWEKERREADEEKAAAARLERETVEQQKRELEEERAALAREKARADAEKAAAARAKCEADEQRDREAAARRERDTALLMKLRRTDLDIKDAVDAWCEDQSAAEAKYGHISDWDTSAVTNMKELFKSKKDFNDDIRKWNVAAVTTMESMFDKAAAFNQPIGGWDVAAVTTMKHMFHKAAAFNQPIGGWNVAAVTTMRSMFNGAAAFNQPIGGWTVSAVTTMYCMFYEAAAFNQPIGGWNVAAVTTMEYMFDKAAAFNQPLENWTVSVVTDMGCMFDRAGISSKPKWFKI